MSDARELAERATGRRSEREGTVSDARELAERATGRRSEREGTVSDARELAERAMGRRSEREGTVSDARERADGGTWHDGSVTAPLTPHEQPPRPSAPHDGDGDGAADPGGRGVAREALDGVLTALVVAMAGVLFGVLWWALAPQVPLISDGTAVYLKDSEGAQPIAEDGWFTLMGLGFGALSALAVFWRRRAGGIAVVLGLAVGGLAASLIAWRLGVLLGPTQDMIAHARQAGVGKVFYAPLALRAKGALLAWPVAALGGFLALTYAFGPRDEAPTEP